MFGLAIHGGAVLLHRAGDEPFWTLPGGRAEFGETAENTIRREMREELSIDVEVLRLLWFVENFFDYDGLSYHEVGLYFLIRFPPGAKAYPRDNPNATVEFLDTEHFALETHVEEIAAAMRQFLAKTTA